MNLPVIRTQISHVGEALPGKALVHSPTLFIRSGTSDYIRENDFEDIHRQFPSSSIQTIQNVGHWVHAEAPAEFLNMALKFLNEG
jgi:esterase